MKRVLLIIIVALLLALLALALGWKDPYFRNAVVGAALGSAVGLLTTVIGFNLSRQSSAPNAARFLFLREKGERLKEAYISYVDVLRLGNRTDMSLPGKSWQAPQKTGWPDASSVSAVQSMIEATRLTGEYDVSAVRQACKELRSSLDDVVHASETPLFEGKESLVEGILLSADYKVHRLGHDIVSLVPMPPTNQRVNLTLLESTLKAAATSVGELLKSLCKLGGQIQIQGMKEEQRMPRILKTLATASVWILFVAGCLGLLVGILSLGREAWRMPAAFGFGVFSISLSVLATFLRKKLE